MSFRDFALGISRNLENPKYPLTSSKLVELLGGPAVESGEQVNVKTALGVTAYYRAVSVVAGTAAGVRLHAYEKQADDNRRDRTDEFQVITDPHPEMTRLELYEWLYLCLELHGNAFFQKIRYVAGNDGPRDKDGLPAVRYLMPIRPELVRVGRTKDGVKVFEVRPSPGVDAKGQVTLPEGTVPLTTKDVLHIPGLGYDGVVGVSPIDVARQSIGTSIAADKFAGGFFGRGALMSGLLQTDRRLPPGAADALQERWEKMTTGLKNSHRIAVLDQGAKYQPIQITPRDAQFLEVRQFSVIEMARLTGVPPHLLMETSAASNWGTGIEEQTRGFITFSLNYRLQRVAARFTKELMPAGVYTEHVTQSLLSIDTLKRYQGYHYALADGWMLLEETRRAENLQVTDEIMRQLVAQKAGALAKDEDPQDATQQGVDPGLLQAGEEIQKQALNGSQIESLVAIVAAVANEEMPAETAKQIILTSFPMLLPGDVDGILSPLQGFQPKKPDPPAKPAIDDPTPSAEG